MQASDFSHIRALASATYATWTATLVVESHRAVLIAQVAHMLMKLYVVKMVSLTFIHFYVFL